MSVMSRCIYCGRPAGLFKKAHANCSAAYLRAKAEVPAFFPRLLASNITEERFSDLLKEVAKSSYISQSELVDIVDAGIVTAVRSILSSRLIEKEELARLLSIRERVIGIGSEEEELGDLALKISILHDIQEGGRHDRVAVAGQLPFKLRPGERVLWVFNDSRHLRRILPGQPEESAWIRDVAQSYIAPSVNVGKPFEPTELSGPPGDLIVTNMSAYFMAGSRTRHFPYFRIMGLRNARDTLHLLQKDKEITEDVFIVEDTWFAANLIMLSWRTISFAYQSRAERVQPV